MVAMEKLNSVAEKLREMKEKHQSFIVSLQLTQKKLERVRGELEENGVLNGSPRKAARARSRGGGGRERCRKK